MITILVAAWFLLTVHVEAVPLSFQNQLNVALQKIAELKGDAFDSCYNVSLIQWVGYTSITYIIVATPQLSWVHKMHG